MIKFLSNWAKGIGMAIVIVSILEMILPENKTKKYVKMVLGTYLLFSIISPFINNDIDFDLDEYIETASEAEVNQESMDKRINELYKEQLEEHITSKVEELGYIVKSCKVDIEITDKIDTTKISKVVLDVEQNNRSENDGSKKLSATDKNNLKDVLKKEYEVDEKCLVIN